MNKQQIASQIINGVALQDKFIIKLAYSLAEAVLAEKGEPVAWMVSFNAGVDKEVQTSKKHITELAKAYDENGWPDVQVHPLYTHPSRSRSDEDMARKFHDAYEMLAPLFGYETREDTKVFDPDSPNGKLMIAVMAKLKGE